MSAALKRFSIALGVVLALLAGLAALFSAMVNDESIKAMLIEQASAQLNATLNIDGALSFDFFPTPSIAASALRLSAPPDQELASAQRLLLGISLTSLLRGELHGDGLRLEGLRVNLVRDAEGRGNWEHLRRAGERPAPAASANTAVEPGSAAATQRTRIGSLHIEDALLTLDDLHAGKRRRAIVQSLVLEKMNSRDEPFLLSANGRLESSAPDGENLQSLGVSLQTRIAVGPGTGTARLRDTRLSLSPASGGTLAITLPESGIDLGTDTLDIAGAVLEMDGLTAGFSSKLDWSLPAMTGHLDVTALDLPVLAANRGFEFPAALNAERLSGITLQANYSWSKNTVVLHAVRLGAGGLQINGEASYTPGERAQIEATLDGGRVQADARIDTRGEGGVEIDAELSGMDLQTLLSVTQQRDRLSGTLGAVLHLQARGLSGAQWAASLSGPLQLHVDQPVLHGTNAEEAVCKAAATLNGESLGRRFEPLTRLQTLDASIAFTDGVGEFSALSMSLPTMSLDGGGRIDLSRRTLRLQLDARITGDMESIDPACRMTRKMQRIEWPITCKGSFDEHPANWCGVDNDDLRNIARQLARKKLKDKINDFLRRH
jgi:hypothetical protein